MVDMAGRRDHEVFFVGELIHASALAARIASTTMSSWAGKMVRKSSLTAPPLTYAITGGENARSLPAKSLTEERSGTMSSVTDGITDCAKLPPPTFPLPRPTLI